MKNEMKQKTQWERLSHVHTNISREKTKKKK